MTCLQVHNWSAAEAGFPLVPLITQLELLVLKLLSTRVASSQGWFCSVIHFIQASPGEPQMLYPLAWLWGPRGNDSMGWCSRLTGSRGLQEEFSEGGGHRVVAGDSKASLPS